MDETVSFLGSKQGLQTIEHAESFDPYTLMTKSSRSNGRRPSPYPYPVSVEGTQKHRLSLRILFSTVIVFIATAGIASALLIWLWIHKTQPSITDIWREGAFLLDEGERTEGDLRSGRLLGLTISSAAVRCNRRHAIYMHAYNDLHRRLSYLSLRL